MSAAIAPGLTERQFQRQVIEYAQLMGWRCAHFRPAQTERGWRTAVEADGAGFPDLVLVRGVELIFCELKAEKGKLSAAQSEWLGTLETVARRVAHMTACYTGQRVEPAGVEVYVWRPSDWPELEERLAR